MKKLLTFTTAIVLLINSTKAQIAWVNYKIDDRLSVKMPAEPVKLDENSFYVRTKDTSIYIIARLDMQKVAGLDSATLATKSTTFAFANSFKVGMAGQMPGSEMSEVVIGKWHDYTTYNINGINASKKLKIYTFLLFAGTEAYSLMTIIPENKNSSGKDYYFNSLIMNSPEAL